MPSIISSAATLPISKTLHPTLSKCASINTEWNVTYNEDGLTMINNGTFNVMCWKTMNMYNNHVLCCCFIWESEGEGTVSDLASTSKAISIIPQKNFSQNHRINIERNETYVTERDVSEGSEYEQKSALC